MAIFSSAKREKVLLLHKRICSQFYYPHLQLRNIFVVHNIIIFLKRWQNISTLDISTRTFQPWTFQPWTLQSLKAGCSIVLTLVKCRTFQLWTFQPFGVKKSWVVAWCWKVRGWNVPTLVYCRNFSTSYFSTPSFNHRLFNPKVKVEKFMVEKFKVESSGLKRPGLKLRVEKSGV